VLSIVYTAGTAILALVPGTVGLYAGLLLIAIGTGGIKPCVSAHVGDQFGETNKGLITKAFGWFYFAINFGSLFSTFFTPIILHKMGPSAAFGTPAILMFIATIVFWVGRFRYIHIPPAGSAFVRETFSLESLRTIGKVLGIFVFLPVFWALYDQTASRWVLQAEHMNRTVFGHDILASQMQVLNPLLVLIFIPLFTGLIYPAMSRVYPLTPLRRIGIGFFLTAVSFLPPAYVEQQIGLGFTPHIAWQALAYAILTAAEVLVSMTALEFAYTQAPAKLKSLVMGLFLLSVSAGNIFTAGINAVKDSSFLNGKLEGPNYYLFFSGLMFLTAVIYLFVARRYKEQTILHEEVDLAHA
jgi:POT family proton-dependent oligopeptide transporter